MVQGVLRAIASLSFILITGAIFARVGTQWGAITETYVNGNWTMVKVEGDSDNPDQCADTHYHALKPSQSNYNTLHSSLLAAHMSGKKVRFWVNGCGGQNSSFPQIVSVFLGH